MLVFYLNHHLTWEGQLGPIGDCEYPQLHPSHHHILLTCVTTWRHSIDTVPTILVFNQVSGTQVSGLTPAKSVDRVAIKSREIW